MVHACLKSGAGTVIIPVQDVLGLGKEARINKPATLAGNWQWRLRPNQVTAGHARALRRMSNDAGRKPI